MRWRLETYWGIPAGSIGFGEFVSLVWQQRGEMLRYLRWADRMRARHGE